MDRESDVPSALRQTLRNSILFCCLLAMGGSIGFGRCSQPQAPQQTGGPACRQTG